MDIKFIVLLEMLVFKAFFFKVYDRHKFFMHNIDCYDNQRFIDDNNNWNCMDLSGQR
jgi:hypothetical protein